MNDAKFLRRGLHMTSYDKSDQAGGALNFTNQNQKAIPYDSDSTNSGQPQRVRKPPRHDRPHSRRTRGQSRYSSSERDEPQKKISYHRKNLLWTLWRQIRKRFKY